MCCVHSPATASTTSSQRGQIVSSDRPPPYPADSPLRSDEGLDARAARAARRGRRRRAGDGEPPPLSPTPSVDTDGKFDRAAAKRSRAGSGDGVAAAQDCGDRIGELPDAILLCILSYLPLRDAARSMTLSSRWPRLFDQYLLDFDACQPFPPEAGRGCDWFIRAVDSILASRLHIRIRSFRFVMYGQGFVSRMAVVSGWFPVLAACGVREIDVDMLYTAPKPTLPASLLQLASLETLRVCFCDLPGDAEVGALRLPALQTLRLSNVRTSQDALQAMLAHCPSLECAKLKNITGVKQIRLRSKSLVCLHGDFANMSELVVEDAPSLEELVGIHLPSSRATVKIVSAPKLQVLGYLGKNVRPLVLRDTVFDGGILKSTTTLMCSVKTLAIQVPFSEKGHTIFVAQLLKCFPCLETLHVEADSRSISHQVTPESWETTSSIQCIEHSLSKLVFENFGGQMCQWSLLTFMLEMAKTLKVIEFYCLKGEDCASRLIQLLCTINRVCLDIKFLFFTSCAPVNSLYLCHCCPRRCQNENRVSLLPRLTKPADAHSEAPET
ncbi:hypothetical protein ZWY2020_004816 [Hordeum vulgare]|nr:hypothetical protein ZWY2020_004816 [Hordeum vulgare]